MTTTCKDVCGKYSGDEGGFSGVENQVADAGKQPVTLILCATVILSVLFGMSSVFILSLHLLSLCYFNLIA